MSKADAVREEAERRGRAISELSVEVARLTAEVERVRAEEREAVARRIEASPFDDFTINGEPGFIRKARAAALARETTKGAS